MSPARGIYEMKGLGFEPGGGRGEMEESETEEGEVCLGNEEDACIDPEVDLSYIDVKLQDVLGHLQREFEGQVSVENLGAKFGGYGSFLPTYKRSPSILCQPESPPKEPGPTDVSSSHRLSHEGTCNDSSVQINAPISNTSCTLTKDFDLGGLARKDASTTATTNHTEDNDLINKGSKGDIQIALKICKNVGPDNISAKNNTAIYSGLGLELSPFASLEDSPEGIKGILEDGITNVSPRSILQIMTGLSISEGCFLSPLQENLLRLTEVGDHFSGNRKGDLSPKINHELISFSDQLNSPLRCTESCRENAMMLLPENIQNGGNKSKRNDDKILEKKVNDETPEGQNLTDQTSRILPMLNSETTESKMMVRKVGYKVLEDSVKSTKIFNQPTESSMMLLNDDTLHTGIGNRNSFELKRSMESDGIVGFKEKTISDRVKPSPRINLTRQDSVEKNMFCGKNDLLCLQKECMDKPENGINLNEVELEGPKVYNDHIFGTNEMIKLSNPQKTAKLPKIKEKLKATAANAISVTDPARVSLDLLSGKEEKKLHASGAPAKNKSRRPKTESLHDYPKVSQREVAWEGKDELVGSRTERVGTRLIAKNRIRDVKIAKKNSRVMLVDNSSDTPLSFEAPIEALKDVISDYSATNAAVAPGSIVIKDNWACCDICEKWRLLPNGINPDDLPKKWTCTMQFWLPVGRNHCLISEDETTMIMNSQCQTSLVENNSIPDHCVPSTLSHVNQVTGQISSIIDMKCDQVKILCDTSTETQKTKLKGKGKGLQCSSNGVDIRKKRDSKLISKGLINSDISKANTMLNPDDFHFLNKDAKLNPDSTAKVAPYSSNVSSAADFTGKQMGELVDKFFSNSLRELKTSRFSLNGTMKTHFGGHSGQQFKQASVMDAQMSGNSIIPVKKRKAREWRDIENDQQTAKRKHNLGEKRVTLGEDTIRSVEKENKGNALNSAAEYDVSKMTVAIDKSDDILRTSRTGKLFFNGVADNQVATVRPLAGGNSSVLKLSSSCWNKVSIQESRGSSLDYVSSSPVMSSSSEKHSKVQNSAGMTDTKKFGVSASERNIFLDGQANGKMSQGSRKKQKNDFIQQTSLESSPASKSRMLSPLDGVCNDHVKASFILDDGKAKSKVSSIMLFRGVSGNVMPREIGGINLINTLSSMPDNHNKLPIEYHDKKSCLIQDRLNEAAVNFDDITSGFCGDSTVTSELSKRSYFRDINNTSECEFSKEKMKLSNVFSEEKELHSLRNDKQGTPYQGLRLMPSMKANEFEACLTSYNVSGMLELDNLVKVIDNKNVAQDSNMRRRATSNAALVAMKDAKELKHAADRMKNSRLELEGNALYFQAALKFLQSAFLSEPSSVVNIKYEELNESLKTYCQTAALCEFCAREYEKTKDMAFAALAYKCMEVAYFKVAFFKNYVASNDHHELQTTMQIFSHGDSPSSSASDLDNLNQPGVLEKDIYSKSVNSLRNPFGHIIASRHSFSRWLDYANISILAFEASRKSQNALLVASASLGKNSSKSITSVEEAINFNFHNVEELLRRIRAAMESLSP